jgi:selenocysteine lyase/cysteine desulfurase
MKSHRALCADLAALLNAGAEDVAFGPNTSTLMGMLGLSFLKHGPEGFNVVTLRDEFPASTVPLEHLGIPLRCAEPVAGRYEASSILDLVDGRTLAVVASHVQYATGFRLDPALLGPELERRGVLFVVNATQGFPYFALDVRSMRISALTASLHKWGLAGHVGSLICASPAFREACPAALAGWLSIESGSGEDIHTGKNVPFRVHPTARQYELGTFNLQPLLGLREALRYMHAIGLEEIRERLFKLGALLREGLGRLGIAPAVKNPLPGERSAIVSFTTGERDEACFRRLLRERIYVSRRAGLLRASFNIFNDESDVARLLDVLGEFRRDPGP